MNYTINTLEQLKPILVGFRKSNGLTQKALAAKLGISQQSYQTLESSPQKVTIERLFRVLAILEVKLQLLDNTASPVQPLKNQELSQDVW